VVDHFYNMKGILLVILFRIPVLVTAQLSGEVVAIADGDTFTMLIDRGQLRVRLHGIDCPEKGQDFSNVARDFLANLIYKKTVTVDSLDTDRYGRVIGIVRHDRVNVNEALLEAGLAWHYAYYDKNPKWADLEAEARRKRRGLWSKLGAVPPWDYRRQRRGGG
jgi:micrococcal nuclease